LKPGEGLVITLGDDQVHAYGEVRKETPMGGLAQLVWLRLEGSEWDARSIRYLCKGEAGAAKCSKPTGHGRMDLGHALREGCDLAFLAWIGDAEQHWVQDYGDSVARARLEEAFAPFLGRRFPRGEALPPLTPAWVGQGELLQTSPEGFLRWLMEPDKSEVLTFGSRYLSGTWGDLKAFLGQESWWFKTATAPVPGDPTAFQAWVVGGSGQAIVAFRMPRAKGGAEGLARLRELLGLPR
jgi:hypothetical protein